MPVIKYLIDQFPYVTYHLWVPDFFVDFAKNLLPYANIKGYSKAKEDYNNDFQGRCFTKNGAYTNLRSHMTKQSFHVLANEEPKNEHLNYLQLNLDKINIKHIKLPEKYVVICTGYTAPIREFPAKYINELTDYIIKKGYTPVFLGKKQSSLGYEDRILEGNFNQEIDYSKGINLIDKTTLLQTGKIIAGAKTIVGVDNGLLHVAGCTNIPIVGGYTSVDPEHRMPYRNNIMGWNYYPVVPPESEPEKFFQSRYDFIMEHDYRKSYLGNDSLIKSLTPELYINELEKIL
jgi:ADP-heptose:LPS heptosyltransferase